MKYSEIIQGKNLYLRDIELTDCNMKYVDWLNDTGINKYLESRLSVQSIESITHFVLNILESKDNYMFAIMHKMNEEHIGNVKIGSIHPVYNHADIGYIVGEKKYWGQGLASEAVYLAAKYSFCNLNLHKLNAGVIAPNIGSIRVLEKLGFKREACIRDDVLQNDKYFDVYYYGVLKTELVDPIGI